MAAEGEEAVTVPEDDEEKRGAAMVDYTSKGHKLQHHEGLVFRCFAQYVVWSQEDGFQRGAESPLAALQVIAPCTRGQVAATLQAWLVAYDDAELLTQVDEVVDAAFAKMPEVKVAAPSTPQQGSLN